MKLADHSVIAIISAHYVDGYKIDLRFSDGKSRVIDFEPFLRLSLNPMVQAYLDIDLFKQFSIEYGDLQWNGFDLCFPVADLYEGKI